MTASTNLFKRIAVSLKSKKKNPDWARVEEPDAIARPALFAIFGMVIIGFSVLTAFVVMTSSPAYVIASFLVSLNSDIPFPQLYAAFGAALIVMIDLVVMTIFLMFAPADNDDIIEMISDLDSNTQERLVELEQSVGMKVDELKDLL